MVYVAVDGCVVYVDEWEKEKHFSSSKAAFFTFLHQVPKGEESTYCPMPIMISSKAYGLQMDTYVRYLWCACMGG